MKVLFLHNRYRYRGGEDTAVDAELRLLQEHGIGVEIFQRDNRDLDTRESVKLIWRTMWNRQVYRQVQDHIASFRPDLVHLHNWFPQLSPAAVVAARRCGVPVVATLHNYRLLCANGLLFRDGQVCEACLGTALPWPAVRYQCYRNSRMATVVAAGALAYHQRRETWTDSIAAFIALTEFARRKFIVAGLPAEKIHVRANCVDVPAGVRPRRRGRYFLFAGRLSPEKGITTLLRAFDRFRSELRIVGDGPDAGRVRAWCADRPWIRYLGEKPRQQVVELMQGARALIVPSHCYEGGIPMVLVEAMALAVPVVASRTGGLGEAVTCGENGLLFDPGDDGQLQRHCRRLLDEPALGQRLGEGARAVFHRRYHRERVFQQLIAVYQSVLDFS